MIDIQALTVKEAHKKLLSKDITVEGLVGECLRNIKEKNQELNALLEVFDIKDDIKRAQEMIDSGKATAITGIPVVIKDNILYKGHISSSSSKILSNYRASYSSPVVEKLLEAGAVIVGRSNMDEFAMGSSTENSAYGVTKNPLDVTRVPGGSSGGSVSALVSGMCLFALGSDTGGSIRQPAAFCGVVGFKPTYGLVTRYGLYSMANSFDQIGPITKDSEDMKTINSLISFYDEHDATSIKEEIRQKNKNDKKVKKIGVPWGLVDIEGIDKETLENFKKNISILEKEGYEIVPIDLPLAPYSLAVYYIIMPAEVSTNLSRFDGIRYGNRVTDKDLSGVYKKSRGEGFGKETIRRVMLGTYVLSHGYYDSYYKKAVNMKNAITKEFDDMFEKVDIIATPTTPSPAFKIGEKTSDPVEMYLSDVFTSTANISGIPAISLPTGKHSNGMPLDIHFSGRKYEDERLIDFCIDIEGKIK